MKQSITLTVISITHAGLGKVTIVMSLMDGSGTGNYNTTVSTADADAVRVGSQYTLSISPVAAAPAA